MAAIVNICVDPRLDHELVRVQVRQRLERAGMPDERVFVTSDVGGNIGSAFRNTADMLQRAHERVVLAGVLHHDLCVAAQAGLRQTLSTSEAAIRRVLADLGITATVASGELRTEDSRVTWADEPQRSYEVFTFRMPRL